MPLVIELSDIEVTDVIAGLRINECNSRAGLANSISKMIQNGKPPGEMTERIVRAHEAFNRLVALRARLGDTKPVDITNARLSH